MDRESIRLEFKHRVNLQLSEIGEELKKAQGLNRVGALQDHYEGADGFTRSMIDVLNEILEAHELAFDDEVEKQKFLDFMRPTVKDFMDRYLRLSVES